MSYKNRPREEETKNRDMGQNGVRTTCRDKKWGGRNKVKIRQNEEYRSLEKK